jgi:hypothetical protein
MRRRVGPLAATMGNSMRIVVDIAQAVRGGSFVLMPMGAHVLGRIL